MTEQLPEEQQLEAARRTVLDAVSSLLIDCVGKGYDVTLRCDTETQLYQCCVRRGKDFPSAWPPFASASTPREAIIRAARYTGVPGY